MKLKSTKILTILATAMFGLSIFGFTPVFATDICAGNLPAEIKEANGCTSGSSGNLSNVVINILNVVIGLLGVVAVIFIIIGGINYMTSSGDSAKVKKARDTILYAVIGLIVSILAGVIVNFVIDATTKGSSSPSASSFTTKRDCEKNGYSWDGKKCN